jgi:hypothetical protein
VIQKQMNTLPVWPTIGKCLLISLVAVIPTQVFASLFLNHVLLSIFIYAFSFFIILAGLKPFTTAQTEVLQNIHSRFPIWISWFVRN